ncbi:hypothetical protein [Nonomuraea indica]|uniref:hypothetical protein n=1 Tax=Nonomuraea indica TaxID=1581193 RepID=UPI000C7D0747|nr:hypothetical protein [Nonomuraea indica]
MRTRLSALLLSAAVTATTLAAASPAAHATVTTGTSVAAAGVQATATAARPKLIRTKIYFGRCKDTCRIKVRIKNVSGKRLYDVTLNARLEINNRKAGSCYDYVGSIRPRATRWAGCTVRSGTLAKLWNRWLDGEIRWDREARTVVAYEYYG